MGGCVGRRRDGYGIKHAYEGEVHSFGRYVPIYLLVSEEEFIWLDLFAASALLFIVVPTFAHFFYVKGRTVQPAGRGRYSHERMFCRL